MGIVEGVVKRFVSVIVWKEMLDFVQEGNRSESIVGGVPVWKVGQVWKRIRCESMKRVELTLDLASDHDCTVVTVLTLDGKGKEWSVVVKAYRAVMCPGAGAVSLG